MNLLKYVKYYFLKHYRKFIKFGLVGLSGSIVDFATFYLLTKFIFQFFNLNNTVINIISPIISYELAVINNFLLSYFWVWKDRKRQLFLHYIKYNISTLLAFAIRFIIFQAGIWSLHLKATKNWEYYLLYIFSVGIAMLINFIIIEYKVFKKT